MVDLLLLLDPTIAGSKDGFSFFSSEEYGDLCHSHGPLDSLMVENNIGLLGKMANGTMVERVFCSASIFAVHAVNLSKEPATAETRVIVLGRSKLTR